MLTRYCKVITLSLLLLSLPTAQAHQLIFLDTQHPVYKDSTNLILEHACTDFQYYYADAGNTAGYDLSTVPTYRYLNAIHGNADINMGGLFMQGRAHYKNLWIKANTLLGGISESYNNSEYDERAHHNSFGGFDDVTLEVGYDFYKPPHAGGHCSIFVMGGFPVNGLANTGCEDCDRTLSNIFKTTDKVRLGTGFYRLGLGAEASAIFYCRDNGLKMLTLFSEFQWNYVFPKTWEQLHVSTISPKLIPMRVTIHPKSSFSIWEALNFNYYNWDFEVGVTAEVWGHFKENIMIGYKGPHEAILKKEISNQACQPVFSSVAPYCVCSYGKIWKGNPYSLSLGIAYEFDTTDNEVYSLYRDHTYKDFQGVQVWGNATYSF